MANPHSRHRNDERRPEPGEDSDRFGQPCGTHYYADRTDAGALGASHYYSDRVESASDGDRSSSITMRGRGPLRGDDELVRAVGEALHDAGDLDATTITVAADAGEVILGGSVADDRFKRLAEDLALAVRGVRDVQNNIRVGARS